jgi:hypothetical protein
MGWAAIELFNLKDQTLQMHRDSFLVNNLELHIEYRV